MKKMMPLVVITVALISVWMLYGKFSSQTETTIALSGQYEDSFRADAVVVRYEYPITADAQGTLQSVVPNGERVTKLQTVAYLYKGEVNAQLQKQLRTVNEQINEITMSREDSDVASSDISTIDSRISSLSAEITALAAQGQHSKINELRRQINALLEKRNAISGVSTGSNLALENLQAEKEQLEAQLGSSRIAMVSAQPGIYYDSVDGYENVLVPTGLEQLTAADAENVLKNPQQQSDAMPQAVCKIVDNTEWYLAIPVDVEQVSDMEVGAQVGLRFTGAGSETVSGQVHSISQEEGKKRLLTIRCTQYVPDVYINRCMSVDVIKEQYSGIRIPAEAVHTQGENAVVYVLENNVMQPRNVTVLYQSQDIAIIKEDNTLENGLLLYDEVVVKSGNIPSA